MPAYKLSEIDRRIIQATQEGLPLTSRPYHTIADQLGLETKEVMQRMQNMLADGVIRRMGLIPNHYALGLRANGMTVWDAADAQIDEIGRKVGALTFVSHCYRRPRHLPFWPYNLFAMVHAATRQEVEEKTRFIADMLGDSVRKHEVLYSTRILKKTGLRINP